MLMRSRPRRIAFFLAATAALVAGPALAADTGNGSKNFNVPASVPNYFSNEAGPILGGAAESRRGELYAGQTAAMPSAAVAVAPPRARQHMAMAEPRGRLIRGRGGRLVAHHVTVHGRPVTRVAAHGSLPTHSAHLARARAVIKTRVGVTRHHARG